MLNASIGQVETMEIVKVLCKDTLVTVRKTYDRFAMANVFYDFPISIILKISIIYDPISAILVENDRAE